MSKFKDMDLTVNVGTHAQGKIKDSKIKNAMRGFGNKMRNNSRDYSKYRTEYLNVREVENDETR